MATELTKDSFEDWWSKYPRKIKKKAAKKVYDELILKEKVNPDDLKKALEVYVIDIKNKRKESSLILHATTFLGPQNRWEEYLEMYDEIMYKEKTRTKLLGMLEAHFPKFDEPAKVDKELRRLLDLCFSIEEARALAYSIRDGMGGYLKEVSEEEIDDKYIKKCSNWLKGF